MPGGTPAKVDLDAPPGSLDSGKSGEILAVDEAISRLSDLDPQRAQAVELRYCGGLTVEETAETPGISPRSVKRDWAMALAWRRAEISGTGSL
jgi:DNA-directed RNA polymerase specialized sigma24 family protein